MTAPALRTDRLNGVSFTHCGACGWHYRFYAEMQGGDRIWLGPDADAYWNPEWGEYGQQEAFENGRAYLDRRCRELLAELLNTK